MPLKILIFLMLATVFSVSSSIIPPQIPLHHLEAASGSYNNLITDIHKDRGGMLWIGTASGLSRYDGYAVIPVTAGLNDTTSVLTDYILNINEDSKGRLWIYAGAANGIYDPVTDTLVADAEEYLKELSVEGELTSLYADADGNIWVAVKEKGIYKIKDGDTKAVLSGYHGEGKTSVCDMTMTGGKLICADRSGNLIVIDATSPGKVQEIKASHDAAPGMQDYYITADSAGRVWMYAPGRLMVYDMKENRWLNGELPDGGRVGVVKSIFEDRSGRVWLARDHHGLELIDRENGAFLFVEADPCGEISGENTVTCFFEDDHGTLWLGTYKQGLMTYNETMNKFSLEDFPDVNCVASAGDAWMWVGTDNSGLWRWNTLTGEKTPLRDPLYGPAQPAVTSLAPGAGDVLYVGSFSKGLRKYSGGKFEKVSTGTPLDDNFIWSLAIDKEGTLWAGTLGGGVFAYSPSDGKTLAFNEDDSQLKSDYVISILKARNGEMWLGTSSGISIFSDGKLKTLRERYPALKEGKWSVSQLYEDTRGLIWTATSNGLYVIDRDHGRITKMDVGDDKTQKYILGVIQDNGGGMWVSIGNMLVNLKINYDEKNGDISVSSHYYDSRDGLMDCDFNQRSFAKLPSGEIVVGGFRGLNRFSPSDMKFNTARPKVMFTDLFMGSRRMRPGEEADGRVVLKTGLNQGGRVEFSHNPKDFSVYFSTDNYVLPEKTEYEYKLVGYNEEWLRCPRGVNHVTYTNLPPGDYTLLVRAINGDGYESEVPGELKIKVFPPFWATGWAMAVYFLLAIGVLWGVVRIVSKLERKRFERRRREDAMRKQEEINQLKFKFFTNVSHDLRTPLTLIVSPLEEMIKETTDERQGQRLRLMRSNAMRLLALVNQLLDFRKNEVAGLQLSPSEGDVVSFSRNVCNSFVSLSERKNINLTFYSGLDRISMLFDQDKLEKILMNLLGNAFKFTPSGGRVDVSLELAGDDSRLLRIKIADTGIGIKDKDKEHIFDRFYQVDDNGVSHPNMGSGIGLSMVYEYVRLHDGTIRVTDNVDHGSVFIVDIPIRHKLPDAAGVPSSGAGMTAPEDVTGGSPASAVRPAAETSQQGERPVALVVDDNPDIADMLRLELDKDFEIVTASDGNEALRMAGEVRPAIILTDLMMPGMDGIELCRRLKADKNTVAIPLIILTAKHDLGVKLEGLTLGADDYITKPFNLDVLRLRMKRLVELTAKGARRSLIDPEPEKIEITPLDEQFIEKAVKYVSDHLDSSELSVEELSDSLGMSRVRLYKKIKQITGKTPMEFIRVIRLKRAAQLLRESQLNVSEIAYRTGFNSPKVFSRYFKEEFGILPSAYQNKEGTETNYTV